MYYHVVEALPPSREIWYFVRPLVCNTSVDRDPVDCWLMVKSWKIPEWPGLAFGPYESVEVADLLNVVEIQSRAEVLNLCGYYVCYDLRHPIDQDPDRHCSYWSECIPYAAFQYRYMLQRRR